MKKQVFRSLVFLSLLLLLLLAAGRIFRPKNNDAQSGIHDVLASGYLSEPEDTLDVIFLGDSLVHTSFIPMRAWENHGITAHICATNGQAVYKSEEFLYSVLQTQHPAVVMLEAHHLYKNFAWTDLIAPTAERLLPVLRYHSRWKSLNSGDLLSPVAYTAEVFKEMIRQGKLRQEAKDVGAENLAIQLFAPVHLLIQMSDGGTPKKELTRYLDAAMEDFQERWKV